jgi:pilus assembly protein TadC
MTISKTISKKDAALEKNLRIAHINKSPEQFTKEVIKAATFTTVALGFLITLFIIKKKIPWVIIPLAFLFLFLMSFSYFYQMPRGKAKKREREINQEIIFAGRYLLVKLESGLPLYNALIEISNSYGVAAKYFKEIVNEIEMGTPIEKALENAREYNASEKLKRILWQIVTSLKTGVDITSSLRKVIEDLTDQQIIEIKQYGKTLNSIMMFYMIMGCVLPSLGFALFTIFGSFLALELSSGFIFFISFMLLLLQFTFIIIIKSTRPMVNL